MKDKFRSIYHEFFSFFPFEARRWTVKVLVARLKPLILSVESHYSNNNNILLCIKHLKYLCCTSNQLFLEFYSKDEISVRQILHDFARSERKSLPLNFKHYQRKHTMRKYDFI